MAAKNDTRSRVRMFLVAGAIVVAGLTGIAIRTSIEDSHASVRAEIARDIEDAFRRVEDIDAVRRIAFKEIVEGRTPVHTSQPCEADAAVSAWSSWSSFSSTPTSFDDAVKFSRAWEHISSFQGLGVVTTEETTGPFIGPRSSHALANLKTIREWDAMTSAGTPWMTAERARNRVRELSGVSAWDFDATLLISKVSWPKWLDGERWDLGMLEGTLWVWSYKERRFVCAAPTKVQGVTIAHLSREAGETYGGPTMLLDALRMRAVALGMQSLRGVVALAQ
ncbi:hypothetical protein [Polyangium sorediatum]|uniref:Uncharacterized protein n=1 Tax=Polyangium sorediatum TaxID=889274 RepID=A0ABT6NSS9_9BACT|nr:hypothetical protein [Polyangium sorediatum]MDI1431378.1 hypothetical protein [Polyangium sorediatum]